MEGAAGSGSASPEPTRSSCLDALVVALNETCDRNSWCTSTKELQLASLEFCVACRNYPTLHLKVDAHTPRRLLVPADAAPQHPKRLCGTRVPRLRARRVTWNMPTAAELSIAIFAMTDVDCLKFGKDFEGSLEVVKWPRRLKAIEFCLFSRFNKPIDLVEWPASLQRLEFRSMFNQPIEHTKFPASLQKLTFFAGFNQLIARDILPSSVQQLDLGARFNQPVEGVVWPSSLRQLRFGQTFNKPVERVAFPASLQELSFAGDFNQPIERAMFSESLQQLSFGRLFNQPIAGVLWPDSLQTLVFGECFNQPVDNVGWPASLRALSFGWCHESQHNRMLIRSDFNHRIGSSHWPASLQRLTVGGNFRQSLQGLGSWMPNLETLRVLDWEDLDWGYPLHGESLLRGIEWPNGLRELTVFKESSLDGVDIPSTVKVHCPDLMYF